MARRACSASDALVLFEQTYQGWDLDPDAAYWHQSSAVAESRDLDDLAEGLAAFKEKRPPRFTGR